MAYKKKKNTSTKLLTGIILVAIIAIASTAIVYIVTQTPSKQTIQGVHVGDVFTYNITADSNLITSDAVTPAYLTQYNSTDYYQVSITGVNGSLVWFDTLWQFTNGTALKNPGWINLATGANSGGFWAIYPSNLKVNDLLSPKGNDKLIVNSTSTQTYATSTRTTNNWSTDNVLTDSSDPTGSTQQDNFIAVTFDKQTGMLTSLTNVQQYNNPGYNILILWQLTNATVWKV